MYNRLITENIDISEDFINGLSKDVLRELLKDHSKSTAKVYAPIFWATSNYKKLGGGYGYFDEINRIFNEQKLSQKKKK